MRKWSDSGYSRTSVQHRSKIKQQQHRACRKIVTSQAHSSHHTKFIALFPIDGESEYKHEERQQKKNWTTQEYLKSFDVSPVPSAAYRAEEGARVRYLSLMHSNYTMNYGFAEIRRDSVCESETAMMARIAGARARSEHQFTRVCRHCVWVMHLRYLSFNPSSLPYSFSATLFRSSLTAFNALTHYARFTHNMQLMIRNAKALRSLCEIFKTTRIEPEKWSKRLEGKIFARLWQCQKYVSLLNFPFQFCTAARTDNRAKAHSHTRWIW